MARHILGGAIFCENKYFYALQFIIMQLHLTSYREGGIII